MFRCKFYILILFRCFSLSADQIMIHKIMLSHKIVSLAIGLFLILTIQTTSLLAQNKCPSFFNSQKTMDPHFYLPTEVAHKEFEELHDKAADTLNLMPHSYKRVMELHPNLNAIEIYNMITLKVNFMAEKLKHMSLSIPKDSPKKAFKNIFYKAYQNLHTKSEEAHYVRSYLTDNFSHQELNKRDKDKFNFSNERLNHYLRSSLYTYKGYLAEYMTAFYVPKVKSSGLLVEDIITPEMKLILNRSFKKKEWEHMLSLEIDVVYNNGYSWGEVKNSFTPYNDGKFSSILKRAKEIKKMLTVFKKYGFNIDFHFFFYNGGVYQSQKSKLESIGMFVE